MTEERNLGELPEARASSFKMVLGVTGIVFGLGVLFCGGVAGYVALTTTDPPPDPKAALAKDPENVRDLARSIALIEIPDGFKPVHGEASGIVTRVCFGREAGDGALLKMGRSDLSDLRPGEDPRGRISLMMQMLEMGDEQTSTMLGPGGNSPETVRELTVLGKNFPFRFIQGTLGNREVRVRKVVGGFMTKMEIVILICTLPEAEYDEQAIVKMIESIRHPQGELAVSADFSEIGVRDAPVRGADVESPKIAPGKTDAPTEGREKTLPK